MADLPPGVSDAVNDGAYEQGPFTQTETKTIEISGPIKITITTKYDSSHVPPVSQNNAVDDNGLTDSLLQALRPLAEAILTKLSDIQRAQGSTPA